MGAQGQSPTTFTGEQLVALLEAMKGSDSVELKLTVPESDQRSTVNALGMDPLAAQIRQVVFFDTPDLALDKAGVVVRARRIQGKPGDSVVKLRPVDPDTLRPELRRSPAFNVEVDALPGGFVCSATMKGVIGPKADVREAVFGRAPIRKLFTKEQRAFYSEHAPDGIALDDLSPLGPITLLKLPFTPPEYGRKLVAEMWFYPDGSRVLELSTRCGTDDAFQRAAEARAFLSQHGIDISGEQQTKTRKALDHFAEYLRAA